jgi:hypothetical protein
MNRRSSFAKASEDKGRGEQIGDVLCIIGDIENVAGYGVRGMGKNKKLTFM